MQYTVETIINAPIEKVVALFDNPDNLKEWQPGLQSFKLIEGKQSEVGAKSELKFKMGSREIEMIETITVRDLPREFSGTYEESSVFNVVKNYFEKVDAYTTKYVNYNEFQFNNLFMKLMGFLMPGMFKKTSQEYMENFKKFVESQS